MSDAKTSSKTGGGSNGRGGSKSSAAGAANPGAGNRDESHDGALLESAVALTEMGLAVFPLRTGSKVPNIAWREEASADPDGARAWWGGEGAGCNIAVATGACSGGVFVIDVDCHGADGMGTLRTWENEHGELPETVTAETGSGGEHLYYRSSKMVRNASNGGEGIDIRGDGGYVVAPPSVHPGGGLYEWITPPTECGIAEADETVMEFVATFCPGALDAAGEARGFSLPAEDIKEGEGRNDALFRFASSLRAREVPEDTAWDAVSSYNAKHCEPPLPERELERTFESAYSKPAGRSDEWLEAHPGARSAEAGRAVALPPIIHLGESEPPELAPEQIEGVLRLGDVAIVSGPSKAGKTWLLMELAVAVATGGAWLGFACRQGRVLYLDGEMKPASSQHRFATVARACGREYGDLAGSVDLLSLRGHTRDLAELLPVILECTADRDYALLIVDPAYKVMSGDENAAGDVREFCNTLDALSTQTGGSVVFAHHHSKGSKAETASIDRMSGSGVFGRYPDAVIDLIELAPEEGEDELEDGLTVWRASFSLRDFPSRAPFVVTFDCGGGLPHHGLDAEGRYEHLRPTSPARRGGQARGRQQRQESKRKLAEIEGLVEEMLEESGDGRVPTHSVQERYGCSKRETLTNFIKKSDKYRIEASGRSSYIVPCFDTQTARSTG